METLNRDPLKLKILPLPRMNSSLRTFPMAKAYPKSRRFPVQLTPSSRSGSRARTGSFTVVVHKKSPSVCTLSGHVSVLRVSPEWRLRLNNLLQRSSLGVLAASWTPPKQEGPSDDAYWSTTVLSTCLMCHHARYADLQSMRSRWHRIRRRED